MLQWMILQHLKACRYEVKRAICSYVFSSHYIEKSLHASKRSEEVGYSGYIYGIDYFSRPPNSFCKCSQKTEELALMIQEAVSNQEKRISKFAGKKVGVSFCR